MHFQKFDQTYVVVLARGEQVVASLSRLCKAEGIAGGSFYGLGAVDTAELAVYDVPNRTYHRRTLEGVFEVTNLTGTIGVKAEGDRVVHAHVTLSDEQMAVFGGHLMEARVSGTMEIIVTSLPQLTKRNDEATGWWVFDVPNGLT
jgi:predicted DNA-binding protein with PD1-like motif